MGRAKPVELAKAVGPASRRSIKRKAPAATYPTGKSYSAHQAAKARMDRRDAGPTDSADGETRVPPVGRIWQDERYDRLVRDEEEFAEKWHYIANNPVKNGIAATAGDYRWLYLLEQLPP